MNKDQRKLLTTIEKTINDLTEGIEPKDFEEYIFTTLFYLFLSTNIIKYIKEHYKRNYDKMSDEESKRFEAELIDKLDYFIKPSDLFQRIVKERINDEYLDSILDSIYGRIEKSSSKKLIDTFKVADLKSKKLGEEDIERSSKLSKLLINISKIKYDITEVDHDTLGDTYEYFLGNFSKGHAAKNGAFYTPSSLAKLLNRISVAFNKEHPRNVYDPTCGSGSLLINYTKFNRDITVYGKERSYDTYCLSKMNMILNNVKEYNISKGDTLLEYDKDEKEKYDLILSNPPFGISWNPDLIDPDDERFNNIPALPPKGKADFAFILHIIYTLSKEGLALVIDTPTMLTRDNENERSIRKYLIEQNLIDSIILLPSALFTNTTTDVCLFIIRKNKIDNKVRFVNASSLLSKEENKNILSDEDIENIVELICNNQDDVKYSHTADIDEIIKNNYDLHVIRYVKYKHKLEEKTPINDWLMSISRTGASNFIPMSNTKIIKLREKAKILKSSLFSNDKIIKEYGIEYKPIIEIADVNTGLNKRKKFKTKSIYPYYYITSKEIINGKIMPTGNTQKISEEAKKLVRNKSKLEVNDLLFAISESEVKTTVITENELDYSMDENVYVIKIKPEYKNTINPYYLRFVMASDYFKSQVNANLANAKAKKINKGKFENLIVPIISPEVQKIIAKDFIQLEEAHIELMNEMINELNIRKKEYLYYINQSINSIQNIK